MKKNEAIRTLAVGEIVPAKNNTHFKSKKSDPEFKGLVESLKHQGMIHRIVVRPGEGGERVDRPRDSDDEAARAAGELVPDRLRGELVAGAVDGEVPTVSGRKIFENAAQLVLSGNARHPERDDHMLGTRVHGGYYSRFDY